MQTTGNTLLITGGGSGIGRALAAAFLALGNKVIISGRRQSVLDEAIAAHPGLIGLTLDIADAGSIARFAETIRTDHPDLNGLILNAGIMQNENLLKLGADTSIAEATIATNLLGPIRLTAALLPQLLGRPAATVMTVSSGLAFTPLALTPTYSATKAAIHSWTQSLRYQLRDTQIDVVELAPPYVRTSLMGDRQANDPNAMPLEAFIAEVMAILTSQPEVTEVLVDRVKPLRFAEKGDGYAQVFKGLNDHMLAARQGEF